MYLQALHFWISLLHLSACFPFDSKQLFCLTVWGMRRGSSSPRRISWRWSMTRWSFWASSHRKTHPTLFSTTMTCWMWLSTCSSPWSAFARHSQKTRTTTTGRVTSCFSCHRKKGCYLSQKSHSWPAVVFRLLMILWLYLTFTVVNSANAKESVKGGGISSTENVSSSCYTPTTSKAGRSFLCTW